MIGRPAKHPAARSGHRRGELATLKATSQAPPTLPSAERALLSAFALRCWKELWMSDAAESWDRRADAPALLVYVLNLDQWFRFRAIVTQAPLLKGSRDQLRTNPLSIQMRLLERQLRITEENFGMSPRSRIALGVSLVKGLSALEDLQTGRRSDVDTLAAQGEGEWLPL